MTRLFLQVILKQFKQCFLYPEGFHMNQFDDLYFVRNTLEQECNKTRDLFFDRF